jgi:hypothetical protein
MKYIVTAGCSFTRQGTRIGIDGTEYDFMKESKNMWKWPHFIQEMYPEHTVLNYGNPTNDNNLIAQSVLYGVSKLLQDNVSPDNIKVMVQWSAWSRNSFFVSRNKQKEKNYELRNVQGQYLNPRTDYDYFAHLNDFISDKNYIGEHGYYMLSGGYGVNHVLTPAVEYWEDYVDHVFSADERLIEHFKNILLVQNFCKVHNISCLFLNMHNNFSFEYTNDNSSQSGWPRWKPEHSTHTEGWHVIEEKYIPNTWENDHKERFTSPYVKFIHDMVDLNNFWFYQEPNVTKFGGIVEWTIKNYNFHEISPDEHPNIIWMEAIPLLDANQHNKENIIQWLDRTVCWQHTSAFMYKKFVQQELKHFIEK